MLNQVILVGRIVNEVKIEKEENEREYATLTIAVPRSYKNAEGIYETDFIDCILYNAVATNVSAYCRKGDIVVVKGILQDSVIEKFHTKIRTVNIIAEKVTFLSNNVNNNNSEE